MSLLTYITKFCAVLKLIKAKYITYQCHVNASKCANSLDLLTITFIDVFFQHCNNIRKPNLLLVISV